MSSQTDSDTEMTTSDDDNADYNDYYDDDGDIELDYDKVVDSESFNYELLNSEAASKLLSENIQIVCSSTQISPSAAKILLQACKWNTSLTIELHRENAEKLFIESRIAPPKNRIKDQANSRSCLCPVCLCVMPCESLVGLCCGHEFCPECWLGYFCVQIQAGVATALECMGKECNLLIPEDFVLEILSNCKIKDRYLEFTFRDHINGHPELRFCPGPNCSVIVRATVPRAKRVICDKCGEVFCFKCGIDYHAPSDCEIIKKWITKCADDSETANYISANTKDCPKCHVCIEKNGGCNHIQCAKCRHDFCWMCLQDWKSHGSEYYECSRYKENPNIVNESVHAQAREALKKYLFYFERWENHAKSLMLEASSLTKIQVRISGKVMNQSGTWIDWQHLLDAAALLKKCRYTLQYTYPYAYYLEKNARKQLFEYQQAQLEAEVENLSWKVERAEITDRGDLENQMDIAEKRRRILLQDFVGY